MDEKHDALGQIIDDLDSLAHALQMPMPAQMHVDALRQSLPEKVAALKAAFVSITGDDPWGTHPGGRGGSKVEPD